ncbi:MAG: FAD-dependent oxidoreductase, partial [Chloroflexota bacterium]
MTPAQAEEVLRRGAADMVGMTRALIADPDMPRKAREGRDADIRICMGTSEGCIDRLYMGLPIGCVQNPVTGREREWGVLQKAETARRVVVVGGGPAGMEAARVAAERGHAVTLFERSDQLGGAIRIASRAPGWEAYAQSVDWLERQLRKLPVTLQLNQEATLPLLLDCGAEAVIVATGARPRRPEIHGVHQPHVHTVADVLAGRAEIKGRCVILDETGYTPGPKVADLLSSAGHAVEFVTWQYSLGEDIGTTVRAKLYERLLRQGVMVTTLAQPIAIGEDSVTLRHMLTESVWQIAADTVIVSASGHAQDELYHALHEAWQGTT